MANDKYYLFSGIMIALGIAFVISAVNKATINGWYSFGILGGGLFIGIGLLPFPIRKDKLEDKKWIKKDRVGLD